MYAARPVLPIPSQQPVLDPETDDALVRECLAEAALRRHLQRVHDSRYASEAPQPRALFRVG